MVYYAAIAIVILCAWFFHSPKQELHVSVPFYGVSRMKWMFSADKLIKESYSKVGVI
jgi:hypothetical protein